MENIKNISNELVREFQFVEYVELRGESLVIGIDHIEGHKVPYEMKKKMVVDYVGKNLKEYNKRLVFSGA